MSAPPAVEKSMSARQNIRRDLLALAIVVGVVALSAVGAAFQTASPGARVTGRIVDAGSGAPVIGAQVALVPAERPRVARFIGPPPQALTNQDGVYVLEGIATGRYRLQAQKAGFSTSVALDAPVIEVTAGQTVAVPDFPLARGGAITGRLLDARGEPLPEVMVTAVRPPTGGYAGGRGIPAGQSGQTNDLGEFRIAGLPPGEYHVAAHPRPQPPFRPQSTSGDTTLVTTYYPGALETLGAIVLTVAPGQTVSDIQFAMMSAPAFTISGIVVDDMEQPVAGATVSVAATADPVGLRGSTRTNSDGTFILNGVTSGTYQLTASVPVMVSSGNSVGSFGVITGRAAGAGRPTNGAIVQVAVEGGHVAGVKLAVVRPR
jgi:hypothetical protein